MTLTLAVRLALTRSACLVARLGGRWATARSLTAAFRLSRHELAFARELLTTRTQLWLFRCNQQRFCGDFIAVDRSAPRGPMRSWAIELKSVARLRVDRRGLQLANCDAAVGDIAANLAFELRPPTPVIGDDRGVLGLL
jgi:hypothetical protein